MSRAVKVQGIDCPIIREEDNIVDIVVSGILKEVRNKWTVFGLNDSPEMLYNINNRDIIGITESVVARAAGQYITVDDIAADIEKKFGKDATIVLIKPIYSRNRFAMILKGIARAAKKLIIIMPRQDEVGNPSGINPFTGVNIEEYYKEICIAENCECEIKESLFLPTLTPVIYCGLHDYPKWQEILAIPTERNPFHSGCTLANICSDKSPDWGVLGTNKATEEKLKLFPSKAEAQRVCDEVKVKIKEITGKDVVVCIYGDGCFKDPVGGIWEFADPTSMPAYTDKELLEATPNEVKLKYFIDEGGSDKDVRNRIETSKKTNLKGTMVSQGTTPRIYRDLLASLMDLTSGSGDRQTPVVLIQNYF